MLPEAASGCAAAWVAAGSAAGAAAAAAGAAAGAAGAAAGAASAGVGSYLATIRENVHILGGPGQTLTSDLVSIKQGDLLVAISFRPYTRNVVTAARLAREAGAKVIAITDAGSPLEISGDDGVTISVDQPFYFDSSTAHFFVLQTILLAAARHIGPAAVEVTKRREKIDKALHIEIR